MADDKDDTYRTRPYGSERFLFRQIPFAAVMLLLGIATQVWPSGFPRREGVYVGLMLAIASFAYIVFACFRYVSPGPPRLVLSTRGIDQRLSHGRILHISWDEVQGVVSVDYHALRMMLLNVPAVLVSSEFYVRGTPRDANRARWHALIASPPTRATRLCAAVLPHSAATWHWDGGCVSRWPAADLATACPGDRAELQPHHTIP